VVSGAEPIPAIPAEVAKLTDGRQRAFPTAQGYGAASTGGRGGEVYFVDSLEDDGVGTLRDALTNRNPDTPRTVVFRVGGSIVLKEAIVASQGKLTIAGQTAPGDGITLVNDTIHLKGDNQIVRHLAVRIGELQDRHWKERENADGIGFSHTTDCIVDHLSISWTLDEAVSSWFMDTRGLTVQNSLFAEPLDSAELRPDQGHPHGYGPLFGAGTQEVTYYRNVTIDCRRRNPRVSDVINADVVNNLAYNFVAGTIITDTTGKRANKPFKLVETKNINVVNNVYKRVDGRGKEIVGIDLQPGANVYIDGNINELGETVSMSNDRRKPSSPDALVSEPARPLYDLQPIPADEVEALLLDTVGRMVPLRDVADQAFIEKIRNNTGTKSLTPFLADSAYPQFPDYENGEPYPDEDMDGMDDLWELQHGLDPTDPEDRNADANGDGYTNLESFLNELAGDIL
tara:strand:+ start:42332 stop:43702 length:1371 start_codon:yes stop_codon:yes gene_type:complete